MGRLGHAGRLGLLAGVGALALLLHRLPTSSMPQAANGDGALAVAFGDARTVLSQTMIRKSDSYFHGGISIDCPCSDCEEGHRDHHGRREQGRTRRFDPWGWINAHVRAPQRHVHLNGAQTVELLPFYWAALRANPHDVEGWTTAIFIASEHLDDDSLTERLLAEAKERNPNSAEIAFAEGRFLRKRKGGKDDMSAARECFEHAERLLVQKGIENWTEDDRILLNLLKAFLDSAK